MKHFLFFLSLILLVTAGHAQMNIGSNKAPDSSAMLQISGTTKGFLPPRMSRDSMYLIAYPATGLLVYNTTDSLLFLRRDTGWLSVGNDPLWLKNGSSIYNYNNSFVGIGTNNPITLLHIAGVNPLTLMGVADGTSTTADSLLTITNGLVKKLPMSTFARAGSGISTADAPITYSNGEIGITQSSATDDGYLSASDYNIFNNKVSSIALFGSPVYTTTTFEISGAAASASLNLSTQAKNKLFAGPISGANAQPTFRSLVPADLPVATSSLVGGVSVGSGLSVNASGVLSATNTSSGSVTSVSVASANGLAGTVANPTTTPAITLTTTVTGMVKGNGTALSAATSGSDYAPGTSGNTTGIVKSTTGSGALTTAVASDFPTLNQNTTGNAATVTTNANMTGDVTSTGNATTIASGVVTNTKLATMAANTFKANNTGATAAPADITGTQATAMLDVFSSTAKGLTPASGGGTANFLRADGTFAVPSGTNAGTVTSVSVTTANGVSGTVATSTTTPAISLTLGAITPTSVAATGTVSGSNLSGTNTGDETNASIKTKLGAATTTNDGYLTATDWNTFNNKASTTNSWSTTGNAGTNSGTNFLGTTDLKSTRFRTNNIERMVVDSLGRIGLGVTDPTARVVLKDSLEIRRVGSLSQLLFTNTASTGDFRIGGDGGDIFWQGGGGRALQMGSYHTTILAGDRQNATFPAYISGGGINAGIGVLVQGQRDASVPLAVQANSASQTANLTNWRDASGNVLSAINKSGYLGLGTSNPSTLLHIVGANPLTLLGVAAGTSTTADSLLTITSGLVRKVPMATFGSGSVTSVSVTTANGVSGTVATSTTTPAISLTLGAITPTSVAATGTVSGSNLSGTNTGDETNATIKTKLGAATTTNDGYLTATDWNTFNNKASTANVISSLNGLTATSQTFAVPGTTGTAPAWSSAGSIHTLNIPLASATGVTAGLLSNADWNTFNNKASTTNSWSTTGNAGTTYATNFLGTTDNTSIRFRTNNTQRLIMDSLGNVAIGATPAFTASPNAEKLLVDAGVTSSFNVISGKGTINSYLQLNIQNKSAGTAASSDVVATADNGDESTNYIDMGVNSSGNTSTGVLGGANTAYLYGTGSDFAIGNGATGKNLNFFTTGSSTSAERMRIDSSGKVGIANSAPTEKLDVTGNVKFSGALMPNNTAGTAGQVLTSAGANTPPTWSATGTVTAVSINSANGFAGTSNGSATAPVLTLQTTVPSTKMIRSNGTGLVAATSGSDYAPGTSGNTTGIVKSTTGSGALTTAVASDFPTLNQNTTGNAATVTTNANMTGDVTSTGNATTIASGVVTNTKLATMAANTFKANNTGATAAPADITGTQATAMLDVFSSTAKGLTPASGGGTANFLRADGTFAVPSGTNAGTVTSVSVTTANGVSGTVATSTTTPAISLTLGAITPTSVAATGTVSGSNLSGTNTGDETNASIKTKLGAATTTNDGYLTATDWNTFNNKASTTNSWSTTGNAGTSYATNFLGTKDSASLRFRTSNTQRMIVDSLGNVGIGTNSPAQKLDVNGTIVASGTTYPNYAYNSANRMAFGESIVPPNETGSVTQFGSGSSSRNMIFAFTKTSVHTSFFGDDGTQMMLGTEGAIPITFKTGLTYSSANIIGSGSEVMRITSGGNVGIGTTTPSTALHVSATTNPLTLTGVQSGATTDSLLTITSAGLVRRLSPSALAISSSNAWSLTGNGGTNSTANFLGTTDAQALLFKVNNQQIGRLELNSFAFGAGAGVNTATNSMALGYGATLGSGVTNAMALGSAANAGISNTFVIGNSATSSNAGNSFAIGNSATVASTNSFVIGSGASTAASITDAFAIGSSAIVNGSNSLAIGKSASTGTGATSAVAIGNGVQANATGSVSIGAAATAVGTGSTNSIAIGTGASIGSSLTNSTAIGANASTTLSNTMILGDRSNQLLSVGIGSEAFSPSTREKLLVDGGTVASDGYISVIGAKGSTNNYLQVNLQNKSNGSIASTDVVATNDAGTELNQTGFVDMGINSSGNTSTGVLGGNSTAYLYSTGNDFSIGNSTASKSLSFFTTDATNPSVERMRIDGTGNVGIGTASPSTKLHIVGANPLTLTGVAAGTSTTADSLLTITSGLVRKIPITTFAPGGSWSTTGNTGTSSVTNFLGTTDNNSISFKTNNIWRMHIDSVGGLFIGDSASSYTNTVSNTNAGLRSDWTTSLTSGDVPRIALQGQMRANLTSSSGSAQIRGFNGSALVGVNNGVTSNADIYGGYFLARRQTSSTITEGTGTLTTLAGVGIEYGHTSSASSGGTTSNVYGIKLNPFYASGTITNMYGLYASAPSNGGTVTNQYDIYLAAQSLTGITNSWGIYQANTKNNYFGGNTGIGSTTFNSSNPEKLLADAGATGNTDFQNVIVGKGNTNNYAQLNIQNYNAGTAASSDVVATADNGSESANYIDMGINSSANTANNFGGINDAYLYATGNGAGSLGGNLLIGTSTATKDIYFLTGGGTKSSGTTLNNERMRILGTGNIGVGVVAPTAALHLKAGTTAAGTAPLKLTSSSGATLTTAEDGAVEYDGTNYFATTGTTRFTLAKTLTNTAALTFSATAANSSSNATATITVTGATAGDVVILGVPATNGAAAGTYSAYVSAANTVTVKFSNNTTAAVTPAAGNTFRVSVLRY